MKKSICIALMLMIGMGSAMADAAEPHVRGRRNECWADKTYKKVDSSANWAYYFCGAQKYSCAGHTAYEWDKAFQHYHGDHFKFRTSPYETYWCCGGTKEVEGKYVQSENWIVSTLTEKVQVAGGTCNKLIQTDACGDTHIVECTTPDNCNAGTILRNGECVRQCEGDEAFENTTSNKCIKCETTIRQGPSADHTSCIKCDAVTEFFDREKKTCIKKHSADLQQYSKEAMNTCWRCKRELFVHCVKAVTTADKMGHTGQQYLSDINSAASVSGIQDIVTKCKLK